MESFRVDECARPLARVRRPPDLAPQVIPRRQNMQILRPARPWRALLAVSLAVAAAPATSARAQLTPEQVTQLQTVGAVAVSPDGRWVSYTLTQPRAPEEDTVAGLRATSELWVVSAAGGPPRPVVRRPASASGPGWSPDGRQLGFVLRSQVHVVPLQGGEPRALTRAPAGVLAFQWSPNGRWIAYTSRVADAPALVERRRRGDDVDVASMRDRPVRLWVQQVGGGEARALTPENRTVRDFTWSPDSRTLAVQLTETSDADADLMFRRIFVVTVEGGAPQLFVAT